MKRLSQYEEEKSEGDQRSGEPSKFKTAKAKVRREIWNGEEIEWEEPAEQGSGVQPD